MVRGPQRVRRVRRGHAGRVPRLADPDRCPGRPQCRARGRPGCDPGPVPDAVVLGTGRLRRVPRRRVDVRRQEVDHHVDRRGGRSRHEVRPAAFTPNPSALADRVRERDHLDSTAECRGEAGGSRRRGRDRRGPGRELDRLFVASGAPQGEDKQRAADQLRRAVALDRGGAPLRALASGSRGGDFDGRSPKW